MNKEKKYFEEHSKGEFIYQSDKVALITNNLINASQGEPEFKPYSDYSTKFFSSDIKWRKELLGKHDFCTSDSANRRLYVWKRELQNSTIWIISGGNGRGTSYEWYSNKPLDGVIYEIFEYLFNLYQIDKCYLDVLKYI